MKFSPLLIPHMLNLAPNEQAHFMHGNLVRISSAFMEKLQSEMVENQMEPREICSLTFANGKLVLHGKMPTAKMRDIQMGNPIDIYGEMPLGHRTRITGFEQIRSSHVISFECLDPHVDQADLPRHTPQSIRARRRRMGFEALFSSKMHWMTKELLNHLSATQILKINPLHYLQYDSGIIVDGSALPKGEALTSATISPSGAAPDLSFGKNVTVTSCAVSLEGRYPEALAKGLPGQSARKIIDHWIFEQSRVNKVKLNKTSTRITFASPGRTRSYAEDEPDKTEEVLSRLRRAEKRHSPQLVKDWDARIRELDQDRVCDLQDKYDLAHIFRNGSGKDRAGNIRISR